MKKALILALFSFFIAALGVAAGESLFYYKGAYQPPALIQPIFKPVEVPTSPITPFTEQPEQKVGKVLIDFSHENNFSPWEIDELSLRIVSRGFTIEYLRTGKSAGNGTTPQNSTQALEEKLRSVDAYVVISPRSTFSDREIKLVKEFLAKNGKLLLIEDPTRRPPSYTFSRTEGMPINDLALQFDVLFENDYLYNMKENEGNYRYVSFRDFKPDDLTMGLGRVVLYDAGSLKSDNAGVIFADASTYSSAVEGKTGLAPMALTGEKKVLSVYDLTFALAPYNTAGDNNMLISNIADWITTSARNFSLTDFPHFLDSTSTISYADVSMLRRALEFKNILGNLGKDAKLAQFEDMTTLTRDTVFLGFFKDAPRVRSFLKDGNIEITENFIQVSGIGTMPQTKTALIYSHRSNELDLLVILTDTDERLKEVTTLLENGRFREWLVRDNLVIQMPEPPRPPEPLKPAEPSKPAEPPKPT